MSLDEDPLLAEAVKRIVEQFDPRRVVLFGSRACGEAGVDSDYDLLVLLDGEPDVRQTAAAVYVTLAGLSASFDVLVRGWEWWQKWRDTPCSLERRIDREGRLLHERS